jgi:photosystem II stability/assembly factor-like uncharacterized protein
VIPSSDCISRGTIKMKKAGLRLLKVLFFCLTIIFLTPLSGVHGGTNLWTGNGPFGGQVFVLAVSRSNTNIIYAGTAAGGVFKSTDSGNNWKLTGLRSVAVRALAVNPVNPDVVYADAYGVLQKSSNGGVTWSQSDTGLPFGVRALVIDSFSFNTLYATTGSGIFKSTDGGNHWSAANSGLTELEILALAIDPSNSNILYAGIEDGVFKSTDAGNNWSHTGFFAEARVLAIDPLNPNTVYTQSAKTTNGGKSWEFISIGPNINTLIIDPLNPNILYAGRPFGEGIYKSVNAGDNWTLITSGVTDGDIRALAIDFSNTNTIYAGTSGGAGILKSANQGVSWNEANQSFSNSDILALAVDTANPNILYSGTMNRGVFKSTNEGNNWSAKPGTNTSVQALTVDPFNPAIIYSGTFFGGIYKSTNGGDDWRFSGAGLVDFFSGNNWGYNVRFITIDSTNTNILYAATQAGIYKSTDTGMNWVRSSDGIGSPDTRIVRIDPTNPNNIYASSSSIYKSTNAGTSWTRIPTIGGPLFDFLIDPTNPDTLYAASGGLFRSTNGGSNWTLLPVFPGPTGFSVRAVVVNPTHPNIIYVGTEGGGVLRSIDNGATWNAYNAGLTNLNVRILRIAPTNSNMIYAGTSGGGVFSIRVNDISFDLCVEDDNNSGILQINSLTGEYKFTNCGGLTLEGTGTLTKKRGILTLEDNVNDRRVLVKHDMNSNKATASIRILSQAVNLSITDRNTTNNLCSCR